MNGLNFFKKYVLLVINSMFLLYSGYILVFRVQLTLTQVCMLSYLFLVFVILFVLTNKLFKIIPISIFIILYTIIQAFGIPLAMLVDENRALEFLMRNKLFYGRYLGEYVALSIIAIVAMFIGIITIDKRKKEVLKTQHTTNDRYTKQLENNSKSKNSYYVIGSVLIISFGLYMLVNQLTGAMPLAHSEYTIWARNRVRNYLQFGYWFGCIFVMSSCNKKQIPFLIFIFTVPSIILIMTGNRNDVLYPLITCLGIYIYRFKKIPKIPLVLITIFVLIISPIIASTRTTGVELVTDKSFSALMASSLCEFGSQLTPISYVFEWLRSGESYAYGLTYIYGSFVGIFATLFPYLRTWFASTRFNIGERLPGLGFSMPGELLFNFSIWGVLMVYVLLGLYCAKKESSELNVDSLVRYSFTCFSLLFLVRNSFSTYMYVIVIFYMLYFAEKVISRSVKKNYSIRT